MTDEGKKQQIKLFLSNGNFPLKQFYVLLKMVAFMSFWIAIISLKLATGNFSVNEQTQLIKSLTDQLNYKVVILLSDNLDPLNHEFLINKQLNEGLQIYSGIWNFKTFIHDLYSDEISTVKTLVVMENDISNMKTLTTISKKISIASFDWLILSTKTSSAEFYLKDAIIPINCRFVVSTTYKNGTVILYEMYRISRNSQLIRQIFGFWSPKKGLHALKEDIFDRRINLRGHEFKFAVHNLSNGINPCQTFQIDNGKQMIQCAYFDVWRELGGLLNYTTKYVIIEDCYKNGSTGISTPMLEMIRTGGADSGEDGYIWSSSRLIHNQFFWPLFHSKVILVTKIPPGKFSFSSYVRPFDVNMWFVLINWLLISGGVMFFTKYIIVGYFYKKKFLISKEAMDNLFLPFTAICYQGSFSQPEKLAIRMAYLMIYLIPVIIIPSYSGSIISSLSVPSENIPFSDLDEFEKDGTYQLNAINNTFFQLFLTTDEEFEILRKKKLISKSMTVSYEESFREICTKRVTFIYEWPLLTKYAINCNVFRFDLPLKKIFSSMAVRKNFPYIELFNRQMQKLISSGLNTKILEKNTLKLFKHEVNPFPKNYFQLKPFGLEDVLPLFAILAVGLSTSLLLLIFEKHMVKSKTKFIKVLRNQSDELKDLKL